jgi:hypothetical protein
MSGRTNDDAGTELGVPSDLVLAGLRTLRRAAGPAVAEMASGTDALTGPATAG